MNPIWFTGSKKNLTQKASFIKKVFLNFDQTPSNVHQEISFVNSPSNLKNAEKDI